MSSSKRQQEMNKLAQYLNETLELHRTPRYFLCLRFGRSLGSYVSSLYLFIKFLYLVSCFFFKFRKLFEDNFC